jgi:hypothetical protein
LDALGWLAWIVQCVKLALNIEAKKTEEGS